MVLNELITALAAEDPGTLVPNGFGNPHSWRGSYYELAFEPESNVTVADMLEAARSADGATYTGWKGGDFTMNGNSDCYLAVEGSCGDELTPALLAVMLAVGTVPGKQSDPRAGLWRVLMSVGVGEERAGLWLDAFAAEVRSAHFAEAADLVQHWHGGAPDVYSPQDSAELLRYVAGGGNPADATYGHAAAAPARTGD